MSIDRKENILNAALELFAQEGYHATPTSKIARNAEVSEGLIFRHYGNKQGLLEAVLKQSERRFQDIVAPILVEEDPKQVIRRHIDMPYVVPEEEYDFWRLQFKLKWEAGYNQKASHQSLIDKLTWALTEMGYDSPDLEAIMLSQTIESISMGMIREGKSTWLPMRSFLLEKYGV